MKHRLVSVDAPLVIALLIAATAFGCSTGGSSGEEAMQFAGFPATGGAELANDGYESRLDTASWFTLRGSPDQIDAALAEARFTAPFAPGLSFPVQESLFDGDLDGLTDVVSATDEITTPEGTVYRHVARGQDSTDEVLHVRAFNT